MLCHGCEQVYPCGLRAGQQHHRLANKWNNVALEDGTGCEQAWLCCYTVALGLAESRHANRPARGAAGRCWNRRVNELTHYLEVLIEVLQVHKEESCSATWWCWDTASVGTTLFIPPCGGPGTWYACGTATFVVLNVTGASTGVPFHHIEAQGQPKHMNTCACR